MQIQLHRKFYQKAPEHKYSYIKLQNMKKHIIASKSKS